MFHNCVFFHDFVCLNFLFGVNITSYDALVGIFVYLARWRFANPVVSKTTWENGSVTCAKKCFVRPWDVATKLLANSFAAVASTWIIRPCDPWICSGNPPRSMQLVWNKATGKLKTWLCFARYTVDYTWLYHKAFGTNTARSEHSELLIIYADMDKTVTKLHFFQHENVGEICERLDSIQVRCPWRLPVQVCWGSAGLAAAGVGSNHGMMWKYHQMTAVPQLWILVSSLSFISYLYHWDSGVCSM